MKHYAPQPLACPPSSLPGNLFTILLQLTNSEATSCNSFQDIFMSKFAKGIKKKCKPDAKRPFNFFKVEDIIMCVVYDCQMCFYSVYHDTTYESTIIMNIIKICDNINCDILLQTQYHYWTLPLLVDNLLYAAGKLFYASGSRRTLAQQRTFSLCFWRENVNLALEWG